MTAAKKDAGSRSSWILEFNTAFNQGRFKDAALLYDQHDRGDEPARVVIQAARANIHTDPTASLRLLLAIAAPKGRERVQRDIYLAEAFARTRDFESADQYLQDALQTAERLRDRDLIAAVGYRYVRRYLLEEDPVGARRFLKLARSGISDASRVYALFAETLILPFEEKVSEQAERLIELLRSLDPGKGEFHEVRAWSTHALAALARELYLPEAIVEVDRQLTGLPWPKDFAQNLFQTLKALGWAKAIKGDYFNGFRHLKHASTVADTTAWKVVAACDRSYLARRFGEHRWSRVELDDAESLAKEVDWHATLGEERTGLLLLAELFGSIDSSKAAMYLARYRELGQIKSPLHYRNDARITAFEQYSTGLVELELGNTKRGIAELRKALRVFELFGYDFRVALCLVAESSVTGDDSLLRLADEKLRNYGQSWLAAEVRLLRERTKVPLPPMQQRVFEEACKGKANSEIAQALGRSEFTVNNHLKQIFKTFKVNSRSALLAEAMRRGLIKTG